MTTQTLTKSFMVEELAPGQYAEQSRKTWSTLSLQDKQQLASIIGTDMVLRIELRYLAETS